MKNLLKNIGPGAMIAAAFIGPGTVTTASLAGAQFGQTLLWAIVFSIFATIILQEMTARLGIFTGGGLGENIRIKFASKPKLNQILSILIISAIFIGNAAYEAGNITGAMLGLSSVIPQYGEGNGLYFILPLGLGIVVYFILNSRKKRTIEYILTGLVALLSIAFLSVLFMLKPNLGNILKSMMTIQLPDKSALMVISLIGTTIVPYNLFLHASTVSEKWKNPSDLKAARWDTVISIILGGLVTLSIAITSSMVYFEQNLPLESLGDLSIQLEPLLGKKSNIFLAVGFICAGITSAITAPLAAAHATKGILGWQTDRRFKFVWIGVLSTGILFSVLKFKPIPLILFAQFTNGLVLPIVTGILIWIMNDRKLLKQKTNTGFQNLLCISVFFITLILGIKSILSVLQKVF